MSTSPRRLSPLAASLAALLLPGAAGCATDAADPLGEAAADADADDPSDAPVDGDGAPADDDGAPGVDDDDGRAPAEGDDVLFDPDHVLEVSIELDPVDWEVLRWEGHDLSVLAGDCYAAPPDSPYTELVGSLTVDGETLEQVVVRKKGFIGSTTPVRPSLKLDLDDVVDDQTLHGAKKLTLNNNAQDPALVRQCLAYRVFAGAGVPAPRCSFAHVTVNGEDLGIYTHVEDIGKPMLRRHFDDEDGNLYEGARSDFRPELIGTFEGKEDEADGAELAALSDVLARPDATLAEIDALVDVAQFTTFWAVESLVAAYDGYSNNRNNFYVYADPSRGRLVFLPWGADMTFVAADPFHLFGRPVAVSAVGLLARRLLGIPAARAAYEAELRRLLAGVWDAAELDAELSRMVALVGAADPAAVAEVRSFIAVRAGAIAPELAAGVAWNLADSVGGCFGEAGAASGTFTARYGSLGSWTPLAEGDATIQVTIDGQAVSFTDLGAVAGDEIGGKSSSIRLVGKRPTGETVWLQVILQKELVGPGELRFVGGSVAGGVIQWTWIFPRAIGVLARGAVTLEEGSAAGGALLRGRIDGELLGLPSP